MKKMKNGLLKSAVLGIGIVLLLLAGCQKEPTVVTEKHDAKSNELIKFNTKNAKYLATQWTDATKGRAADNDALDSLIAIVPKEDEAGNPILDGNGDPELEEETVLEVPTEELKLESWCVPQPVREVYTCTYPTAEPEARGVYTVFNCYIDWWKYTNGDPAPGLSMIMYVTPDGEVYDVLNINGKVKYFLTTWIKENDGEDYLQFDGKGNLFMLAHDDYDDNFKIFRFNPGTKMIDTYQLQLGKKDNVEIRNFAVTRDGEWVFLNVMVNKMINNVYAFQVNTNKTLKMYEYNSEIEPKEPTWAVSSIGIDPKNNLVYWYVDEYNDPLRPTSGLYVAERQTTGYSEKAVTRHAAIGWWDFVNVLETEASGNLDGTIPKPNAPDYPAVIDYLMNAGGYDRSKYQFDLSYFADKNAVTIVNWEGKEETKDFSKLYKCAVDPDSGEPLTDEALLKFLVDTPYKDVYGYPDWCYKNGDPNDELDPEVINAEGNAWLHQWVIGSTLTNDFFMNYWCEPYDEPIKDAEGNYEKDAQGKIKTNHVKTGAGGYKTAGYSLPFRGDGMYIQPVFPFEVFIHNKTTGDSFGDGTIDKTYLHSVLARNYNGIIISNDEGTWVMNDIWDDTIENADGSFGDNDHALIFKLTDKRGNFVCTQPDGIDKLTFKPRWSKKYQRDGESDEPWYKKPFAANSKGFAALAKGGTTIYYHTDNEMVDLLKGSGYDFNFIYSFSLSEDTLICNGVKALGGDIMLSIDLETRKVTKLPIENKKVESMLAVQEVDLSQSNSN